VGTPDRYSGLTGTSTNPPRELLTTALSPLLGASEERHGPGVVPDPFPPIAVGELPKTAASRA
jgi:hypothetical protein